MKNSHAGDLFAQMTLKDSFLKITISDLNYKYRLKKWKEERIGTADFNP